MKTYNVIIGGKNIEVIQNEDGTFNKPEIVKELLKFGTAMKPAHEPICMARKPLSEKTVAENVLKYGTGGINIDESRVETTEETRRAKSGWQDNGYVGGEYDNKKYDAFKERENNGRFPANLILSWKEDEYELKDNLSEELKQKITRWINENA